MLGGADWEDLLVGMFGEKITMETDNLRNLDVRGEEWWTSIFWPELEDFGKVEITWKKWGWTVDLLVVFRVIWLSFPWFAFESSVCVGWRAMLDHAEVIAYEFWGVLTHVCFAKWCETLQALMSDFMINYVSWHLRLMSRLLSLSSLSQQ